MALKINKTATVLMLVQSNLRLRGTSGPQILALISGRSTNIRVDIVLYIRISYSNIGSYSRTTLMNVTLISGTHCLLLTFICFENLYTFYSDGLLLRA